MSRALADAESARCACSASRRSVVPVVPRNEDGHHGEDDECSHSGPARQLALSLYLYLPETKLLVSLPARALLLLARKPQVLRMFAAGVIELALDLREREALTHAMRYKFCRPSSPHRIHWLALRAPRGGLGP